jgi:Tol biopolymer transport system component
VPTTEWTQLTDFADSVTSPSFSPDGRMLAFLRGDGSFVTAGDVYVMLLPHGTPARLTHDTMPKMSPVFSPDGSTIAYTVPWETWTVPVLGGEPRRWLPNASGLTWRDADNVIYSQITVGNHMEVVASDRSRANAHSVYSPGELGMAHRSYVSPDRKWVIVVEMIGGVWKRCRLVPFDGSSRGMAIGPADGACTAAAWSPDGAWMFLNSSAGGVFHIWRERLADHRLEQITAGPMQEDGIAIAPDGQSIVTAVGLQRSTVWLHDSRGERPLTSEASASLADPRNGSPFSRDGTKLYYLVRRGAMRDVSPDTAVGELWEVDLRSGATQAVLPGFSISEFSQSPDGREIVFAALDDEAVSSLWLAPLDRSASPRKLQAGAHRARFAPGFIYYVKRTTAGSYVHRMRADGSGDEQIWDAKVVSVATSPDGRYLAATVPISKDGEWMLEVVDWARKRVQPVAVDTIGYWSDDGRSFFVTGGIGKANETAMTYVVPLASADAAPDLPSGGLSDLSQLATSNHAQVVPLRIVPGRSAESYAFVKQTTQRNLYSVPLH